MKCCILVNNVCGCCDLKTGGLVIAGIYTFLACIEVLCSIAIIVVGVIHLDKDKDGVLLTHDAMVAIGCIYFLFYGLHLAASIMLIYGIKRKDTNLMYLPLIMIFISILMPFFCFVFSLYAFIGAFVNAAITSYFYVCLYSLYQQFTDEMVNKFLNSRAAV